MGRPINSRFFGNDEDSIAIKFHDGSNVVVGYVIKQLGTTRYRVTDGSTTKTVTLAQTTYAAQNITGDLATIEAVGASGTIYITRLSAFNAFSSEGDVLIWVTSETTSGKCALQKVPVEGELVPPEGFFFVVNSAGDYVIDGDGNYVVSRG